MSRATSSGAWFSRTTTSSLVGVRATRSASGLEVWVLELWEAAAPMPDAAAVAGGRGIEPGAALAARRPPSPLPPHAASTVTAVATPSPPTYHRTRPPRRPTESLCGIRSSLWRTDDRSGSLAGRPRLLLPD